MCWLKKCLKCLRGEEGYGLAELLVIASAVVVIAGSVLSILLPEVRVLYQKAVSTTTDILGSGF